MNYVKLINFCLILWVTGIGACTKNTLNLPAPAPAIEGVYEAQNNKLPFPIQGQTLRLTVKGFASDSANVVVQAVQNGVSADSLVYHNVLVNQAFTGAAVGKNCVGYLVKLPVQSELEELFMTCDEVNVFNCLYRPAGPKSSGIVVKFKKI